MADDKHDPIDAEHKLPWPEENGPAKVGEQFSNPNLGDDRRLGKRFEETNSSGKQPKPTLEERIHWPETGGRCIGFCLHL
jgi:hypothetical protein